MRTLWLFSSVVLSCTSATFTGDVAPDKARVSAGSAREAFIESGGPLVLKPGQVAEVQVTPGGGAAVRLATPAGSEEFVLILGSTSFESGPGPFDYSVAPSSAAPPSPSRLVNECALSAEPWGKLLVTPDAPPSGVAPNVGAMRVIHVTTPEAHVQIDARAISVGQHAVVWADTTHPTSLDQGFAQQFRDDFERVILPRARQVFGTEPDIDGDGRIQLVFSKLTRERGVAFFSGCDLLATQAGCTESNQGEYLYLTPPDAINPPYNTPNAIKEILTHELSHLLHFNRKVLRNRASEWTDSAYMAEGIGALAQDVVGYQAGNLYVAKAGLDGVDGFSLADVLDPRPREGAKDGVLRGGAYLFVRYLYDRAGGDVANALDIEGRGGPAFMRALIDARDSVASALPRVSGATMADLGIDFFTTLALSNREQAGAAAPQNPCFAFLPTTQDPVTAKQRGTNLFAAFHGMRMSGPHVGEATAPDGQLRAGGVEYLHLAAKPNGGELAFSLQVDPQSAPRLRVARWK